MDSRFVSKHITCICAFINIYKRTHTCNVVLFPFIVSVYTHVCMQHLSNKDESSFLYIIFITIILRSYITQMLAKATYSNNFTKTLLIGRYTRLYIYIKWKKVNSNYYCQTFSVVWFWTHFIIIEWRGPSMLGNLGLFLLLMHNIYYNPRNETKILTFIYINNLISLNVIFKKQ